jgi:hypothetical protein
VVTGGGVFDDLMETINTHLDAQFKLGRITGTEYSTVYLGALQSAAQNAVSYVIGQEKTNSDVASATIQDTLISAQKLKVDADTTLVTAQELKVDADKLLVNQQVISSAADDALKVKQGLLVDAQELKTDSENLNVVAQTTLLVAQELKVDSDTALNVAAELKVDAEKLAVDQEKLNAAAKSASEVSLLNQKTVTEYVQTGLTSSAGSATSTSTMGRQQLLYQEQAKGFQWNADQKYLKTLLDAWAINTSTAGVAATGVTAINETGVGNINTQITNAEPT